MHSTIHSARVALRTAGWTTRDAAVHEGGRAVWVVLACRSVHSICSIAERQADAWCEAARVARGLGED
jgi:hypothetical protein